MDELGESLPSESLLVPHSSPRKHHHSPGNEQHHVKYPFLKKGSRKEPSALMGSTKSPKTHVAEFDESVFEASLVSNSDLLGDTTNSDIHNKWLENQKQAQLELHEFEMIERDLDKIQVAPLLMSTEGFLLNQPQDSKSLPSAATRSKWTDKSPEYYLGLEFGKNKASNLFDSAHKIRDSTSIDPHESLHSDHQLYDEDSPSTFPGVDHCHSPTTIDEHHIDGEPSTLVSDTKFLRVSQSQNPFRDSPKTSEKGSIHPEIDDSLSWNDSVPHEVAIRPSIHNRTDGIPTKKSHSPRYKTFHQPSGAIDEHSSEWNRKSRESNQGDSISKRNLPRPSSAGQLRSNQRNHSSDEPQHLLGSSRSKVILDEDIILKAKQLEEEISTYQRENSQIKSLRKKHEAALAEIQEQKQELKDWIEAEKRKTEKWCEETKEAAKKEKRAAAQYMRDARNTSLSSSIRKDRAEIEALQATITKLTIEHAETVKKLKANISRLHQSNKTQSETISQLESQVAKLELEKLRGVKPQIDSASRSTRQNGKLNFGNSFVEEVDASEAEVIWNSTQMSSQSINSRSQNNPESFDDFDLDEAGVKSNSSMTEFGAVRYSTPKSETKTSYDPRRYHQDFEFYQGSNNSHDSPKPTTPKDRTEKSRFETSNKERVIEIDPAGVKITRYSNGTVKYNFPNGVSEVHFTNGDVKRQNPNDSTLVYFYAQANTTHTTHADGTEIYEFPSGQVEKHFPSGQKIVTFADGTIKTIFPDGNQESVFPDGIIVKEFPNGKKEILEPSHGKY